VCPARHDDPAQMEIMGGCVQKGRELFRPNGSYMAMYADDARRSIIGGPSVLRGAQREGGRQLWSTICEPPPNALVATFLFGTHIASTARVEHHACTAGKRAILEAARQ
jgi:hypothetical protein